MKPDKLKAVVALVGGEVSGASDGSEINYLSGQTPPTESKINEKLAELQADYETKKYQRDRVESYPDLAEQLDLLWHAIDGGKFNVKSKETDFYKKLKAVKDANPKPE